MKIIKVNSNNVYFTSDTHFHHDNILKFCSRNCANIDEMNMEIIKRWNTKIPKDATVFLLGDVSWKGLQVTKPLLDQLNGDITLIVGNHDPDNIVNYFKNSYDMLGVNVVNSNTGEEVFCHLCHFPLHEWNRSQRGSIHLHGHCHGNNDNLDKFNYKRLDVGLDSHNLTPLSWEDIEFILTNRYMNSYKNDRES